MSDADDTQIGTILSRREVLATLGAAGAAFIVPRGLTRPGSPARPGATALPGCIVRPAQTEGPYFVDTRLDRSDIRPDPTDGYLPAGLALELTIAVSRLDGASCAPYRGVLVDIWQCDALGIYSGVQDMNGKFNTVGKKFLRGHQRTGADGVVRFRTIYPGFYEGRTTHIHFKIRTNPDAPRGREFVSQLYFDDATSDRVFAKAPYSENRQRRARNQEDSIFRSGGKELLLTLEPGDSLSHARFEIGLTG